MFRMRCLKCHGDKVEGELAHVEHGQGQPPAGSAPVVAASGGTDVAMGGDPQPTLEARISEQEAMLKVLRGLPPGEGRHELVAELAATLAGLKE